ncbi:sensor histidine kinase [Bradyrhizobium sp. Cp5.3]|uniref:sensor histidine kinase n=1 Tax=Bradyrhizobium sp. Cp5.3 TaxID=443598 RepID=UPI00041F31BC|nr:sensor histidine kinase [Bradyrhizobium sp. Cp5.3]
MSAVEFDLHGLIGTSGEFRDGKTEEAFSASIWQSARAMALLCILADTAASLSFLPLDFLMLAGPRLAFFVEVRLLIALAAAAAVLAVLRTTRYARIVAITHVHQVAFFTLNALIFNHPSLTRHGGLLLPLIAIALNLCLPGRFRWVALTSAYAPTVSLLFWAMLRPDPESPLDLTIIVLVVLVGYVVGAVSRTQFNRLRREEYLRIARERQTNLDLREAKDAAEAAASVKADFLAVMSHEIRTPMNGILGMAQLALDDPLPLTQRRRVSTIRSSAEGLLKILDDILDISKLERQAEIYERAPFDIRQSLREIVNLMTPRAHEKGLTLELVLSPAVPRWVLGDQSRVRQILFNLIGNALKFTSRGGVRVEVTTSALNDEARVVFCVSDTGIGITPEQQANLFQSFEQGDASIRRRFGGTGLGLAICKRLVEGMKGEIEVESMPRQGSRFRFSLPLPADDGSAAREVIDAPTPPARPLNLLLVEDLHINAEVARGILERAGHRIALVRTGEQAVELVRSARFDAVLMDVQMPDVDGLEATRRIRALPLPLSGVPIVALTANVMSEDVDACRSAGMDGHLAKPIDVAALHRAVEAALQIRQWPAAGPGVVLTVGGDVLVVGDARKATHGPLRDLGFRVFPAGSFEAAGAMLAVREFAAIVAVAPPAGFLRALRARASDGGRRVFIIAAAIPGEGAGLLEEGADLVLAAPLSPDEVVWKVEAFLAPQPPDDLFTLEEVFGRDRIDEFQELFAGSLLELDRALARDDLTPKELASIAHRIKGSAANLRMPQLAASADDALIAARTVVAGLRDRDQAVDALRRQIGLVLNGPGAGRGAPASTAVGGAFEEANVDSARG